MAFRSKTQNAASSGTTITITKPAGVVDDDILMVGIAWGGLALPNSTPAGWSLVSSMAMTGAQSRTLGVWQKVASGEGASWQWGWAAVTNFEAAAALAYDSDTVITGQFDNATEPSDGNCAYAEHANSDVDVTVVYFEFGRWFSAGGTSPIVHTFDAAITSRVVQTNGTRVEFDAGDEVVASGNIPARTNDYQAGTGSIGIAGIRTASSFLAPTGSDHWGWAEGADDMDSWQARVPA